MDARGVSGRSWDCLISGQMGLQERNQERKDPWTTCRVRGRVGVHRKRLFPKGGHSNCGLSFFYDLPIFVEKTDSQRERAKERSSIC